MAKPSITGINHVCVVTADLEQAMATWSDRLGVGPWKFFRYGEENMSAKVSGEPAEFGFRAGLAFLEDGSRIELIQPLDENSLYAESLRAHDGADHLHHVRLNISDYEGSVAGFEAAGAAKTLDADFTGAGEGVVLNASYFDTEPLIGFTVELGAAPPNFTMPTPEGEYPPPAA